MLASAILLAAGCVTSEGLEPNARLQPAGALQAGRSLDGVALSPAAWPRQDWWTGLGDRQLDQLIGEALQGTPDLQIAEARARQAAATAQAQDAARQPTLDAKASYSGIRAPTSVAPAPLGGRYSAIKYLSLGFNYDFDLWGGERAAWEAALGQANAARIDSQAARIGLSASIARAYSDLAHAFTVRDLAEEELKRSQRMTELSQKRMSAGLDSKVQLQQTQTQLATARQQLSAAEQDIASARIALAVLLGKGPDRGLELQRPQPLNPASLSLPSVLPAELLGRRADIVAARWRVEAARRNIDSAKTEFYPNLNLGAMAGLAALHTSDVLQAPSRFFQVAPAISCRSSTVAAAAPTWPNATPTTTWPSASTTRRWSRPSARSATTSASCAPGAAGDRPAPGPRYRQVQLRPGHASLRRRRRQLPRRPQRATATAGRRTPAGQPGEPADRSFRPAGPGPGRRFPTRFPLRCARYRESAGRMNEAPTMTTANSETPAGNPKRKRWLLILLAVIVLATLASVAWEFFYGRWHEDTDDAYINGNVVQITPQIVGTVVSIGADDGDLVRKGQELVRFDPSDADIALQRAEANLAHTVRQVRGLFSNVDGYRAEVATRKVALAKAEADYKRRKNLADDGAISQEELAHARDALDSAKASLTSSEQQLNTNRALVDDTQITSHPDVKAAAAQLRQAYLDDARSTIVAPVTGYVAKRSVQVGQRVQPGNALMAVVPLDQIWIDANFKETQLKHMRIGQPVEIRSDLYGSDVRYSGTVDSLGVGTGSAFSLLPAQNATGNWIKIVQRVPVRIHIDPQELQKHPLRIGLSMDVKVDLHDQSGPALAQQPPREALSPPMSTSSNWPRPTS